MKEKRLPVKQLGIQDWRESQSEKDCTSFLKNERQTDVLSWPNSCHSLQKNVLMEEGREIRQEKVKVSVSPLCPFQTKQKLFFFFANKETPKPKLAASTTWKCTCFISLCNTGCWGICRFCRFFQKKTNHLCFFHGFFHAVYFSLRFFIFSI